MILSRTPGFRPKRISTPSSVDELANRRKLVDCLLANRISIAQLEELRKGINADELSEIIQRIYDLNEKYILELSAVDGLLRRLNNIKNKNRNNAFERRIRNGFRDLKDQGKKVILAEGDSWFNYPLLLTDIIDRIRMEKNFSLYSLAAGGDWFLNMLSAREYVEELSIIHPDVFLISAGGNDLVGSRRLAAIVDPEGNSSEYTRNTWAATLIEKAVKRDNGVMLDRGRFSEGCRYLSKDFFALLMFFHLQYYFLIHGLLGDASRPGKFMKMKIITQGYDYAIPSTAKGFGWNPLNWYIPFVRTFLGHGTWLKEPLLLRGVPDDGKIHQNIVYAMIFLFNEMMIDIGYTFRNKNHENVWHIDSRGTVGEYGWADELHAKPEFAMRIAEKFIDCINGRPSTYDHVYVVSPPDRN